MTQKKSVSVWNSVTTFSKLLALSLYFIIFALGMMLGKYTGTLEAPVVIQERMVRIPVDNEEMIAKRCGDIPDTVKEKAHQGGRFTEASALLWSPDCRHIIWSKRILGIDYLGAEPYNISHPIGEQGVFLYTESSKNTESIYTPEGIESASTPILIRWIDQNTILYNTTNKQFMYDLRDKVHQPVQ